MFVVGCLFLVLVLAAAGFAWAFGLPRAFSVHGVFALAALPLIWAAMLHFVPVLTRSAAPDRRLGALPVLAMVLAALLLAVLAGVLPRGALLIVAPGLAGGAAVLLAWMLRRARRAIGAAHPGLRWYVAALFCLLLGLAAVAGLALDAPRFGFWYRLHLHLMLFGWVGLTVLGTLPVLLPTALARPGDGLKETSADATFRLRRGLPWALAAVLTLALAAAGQAPVFGAVAALLLLGLLGGHGRDWLIAYGTPARWPGPALSLAIGAASLALLLVAGIAHAFGALAGVRLLPAFAAGFLLPTVLGALAQLLPVWRFPGPDSPARQSLAAALARGAGWRGGFCALAGFGAAAGFPPALALAGLAVAALLATLLAHLKASGSGGRR